MYEDIINRAVEFRKYRRIKRTEIEKQMYVTRWKVEKIEKGKIYDCGLLLRYLEAINIILRNDKGFL